MTPLTASKLSFTGGEGKKNPKALVFGMCGFVEVEEEQGARTQNRCSHRARRKQVHNKQEDVLRRTAPPPHCHTLATAQRQTMCPQTQHANWPLAALLAGLVAVDSFSDALNGVLPS